MIRVGLGYDLHRLVEGRRLILGGVVFDFEKGEDGHSDGDVLFHAITDAVLGAAGLGDIGSYFPPEDAKWKDADSSDLLRARQTAEIIAKHLDIIPVFRQELRERYLGKCCGRSIQWLRENKECEEKSVDDRLFSDE